MKMTKTKRFTALLLSVALSSSCVIGLTPVKSHAATLSEQKAAYNSRIQNAEAEIANLKKKKADQQQIADKLKAQLNDLTNQAFIIQQQRDDVDQEVTSLTNQIKELTGQISDTEKKLVDMNESIDNTVDVFCQRLRANYMSGPTSYLDILLNSTDLSSMLNQIELMKRVTDSDQKLVDKLNSDIDVAEKLKGKLNKSKDTAESKKTELNAKKVELDASKAEYDKLILNAEAKAEEVSHILYGYNSQIEALHEDVNVYKDAQADIDKAIKAAEAQRKASGGSSSSSSSSSSGTYYPSTGGYENSTISTSGWMWPVPAAYISSYYGYRSDPATGVTKFHAGIDLAAPCNSNILATKAGTVIFVNYGNTGYGNHIMIGHSDGTYSLYAHCLPNFPVSTGQSVSQGQVIAHVGTSGYSTGYHCHFEIRDGSGNKLNPLDYVHK